MALEKLGNSGPKQLLGAERDDTSPNTPCNEVDEQPQTGDASKSNIDFPVSVALPHTSGSNKLRVGTVLSASSEEAWGYEWECINLQPTTWRKTLQKAHVSLLFVDSSWADSHEGWADFPGSPTARRQVLSDIVEWCRSEEIPAVYWSREAEPSHVDLRFALSTFDKVFVSDAAVLKQCEEKFGPDRIEALGHAAQPKLHNPVRLRSHHQTRDMGVIDGAVFSSNSAAQARQMEYLIDGGLDTSNKMGSALEVLSPLGSASSSTGDLALHNAGTLPSEKMLSAYKAFKCFLTSSSQEIIEITASGTPVVMPADVQLVVPVDDPIGTKATSREDAANATRALIRSTELRDRTVHLGQRSIWERHTYAHRAASILRSVGVDAGPIDALSMTEIPTVSVIASTIRPERISDILTTLARQEGVKVELVLLAHGFEPEENRLLAEAASMGLDHVVVLTEPRTTPLGECLNLAVAAASGVYLAKMDDDDLYGANYLRDQAAALRYSGAVVAGKHSHYMHLSESNVTLLRFEDFEHRFTDFVMGPTIFTTRETLRAIPFEGLARGEDSEFLRSVRRSGGTIYSGDRFNFVQVRSGVGAEHTWSASERALMATGVVSSFGLNTQHIMF
ncbi:glycosyltransferase [Paenarthrobacter nitroguajacolicus]|uniref:glycosyltransferase family protein n=1 Tax=Paenarthrobacter nitroguajacolicus TaxID=211146 RepID=UPI00285BA14B|nr:glycosyltransferase [Paenarthrobacter nitroguajacolicus]MDR6639840.1 hypothetical protein [Paenarthrobacter nitroguajacolicus]